MTPVEIKFVSKYFCWHSYQVEKFPITSLLSFYCEGKIDSIQFLYLSVYMIISGIIIINDILKSATVKLALHSWDKHNLVMVYYSFHILSEAVR